MRITTLFNDNWTFVKKELAPKKAFKAKGESVTLPHTWNNLDGQDGGSDYVKGAFWYTKKFANIPHTPDEKVYVQFEAVNSVADVYVNGTLVAHHEGGFSTFRADITPYLKKKNIIAVCADSSPSETVYPQWADFTFDGGIYRDVSVIVTNNAHFDLEHNGGCGVTVTPTIKVGGKKATVDIVAYPVGTTAGHTVNCELFDAEGVSVASGVCDSDNKLQLSIAKTRLWNGRLDPHLYTAKLTLCEGDKVCDNVDVKFGVRTFSFDANTGFILNGKPYHLHGVSRHQCRQDKGWAISKADHEQDIALIAEVGATTIRLAHYQHDQYFYDLCDKYGMVVWAEIPFISMYLPKGDDNTVAQMKDLVIQNYHHASIVCWGLSNEITIGGETPELVAIHHKLNDMVHAMDSTRVTTMAQVSMLPLESELNQISDILSYNHYFGWYGGEVADNGEWFDNFHKTFPDKCFGLSEYGCEAVLNWHTSTPEQGDYSEEYQAYYHEKMLETFAARPYMWSTHVWNMFDFASDMRDEGGVKGRNNKGLVTMDRTVKKDSFYAYKAHWSTDPFVHLTGKRYAQRCEDTTLVKVYSNCENISLFVNGELFEKQTGKHVFNFQVPLTADLAIEAVSGCDIRDTMTISKVAEPVESYKLASVDKVANWFDENGNEQKFEFPEGYFSIKDKLKDIMAHPEGKAVFDTILANMASGATDGEGQKMEMPKGMMKMMGAFTVQRLFKLAGDRVPQDALYNINCALNKIKK